jgi:hypothetical protein
VDKGNIFSLFDITVSKDLRQFYNHPEITSQPWGVSKMLILGSHPEFSPV